MDQELEKAAKVIEEAGGFVMFPEDSQQERDIRKQTHNLELQEEAKKQAEIDESKSDYEQRKANAFEEFEEELGSPGFSFNEVSDLCYRNGIDLDDIEEYIFSHY